MRQLRLILLLLLALFIGTSHGFIDIVPARTPARGQFSFTAGGAFTPQHLPEHFIGLGSLTVTHAVADWFAVQVHGSMYFAADENLYHETGRYSVDYRLKTSFEFDDIPLFLGGSVGLVSRSDNDGVNAFNNITLGSFAQYGPFYFSVSGYLVIAMTC